MIWPTALLNAGTGGLVILWLLYGPRWLTVAGIVLLAAFATVEVGLAVRWGALCERIDTARATVGGWSLTRDGVTVTGWLLPHHRPDAALFAYRLTVMLNEDDITAQVGRESEPDPLSPPSGGPL